MRKSIAAITVTVTMCLSQAAPAHHSFAMFDAEKSITIAGTVKEFQWMNPHIWIQIMARDAATDREVEWSIEGGSPGSLARKGWKRTSIKPGDRISLTGHPLRNGEYGASLMSASVNGVALGGD